MEEAFATLHPARWNVPPQDFTDAMPVSFWVVGSDGELLYANKRLNSYHCCITDKNGRFTWTNLLDGEDLAASIAAWNDALRASAPYEMRHRFKMADGSSQWHLTRAIPRSDQKSGLKCWYFTATNIHLPQDEHAGVSSRRNVEKDASAQQANGTAVNSASQNIISTDKFLEEFATRFSSYDGAHEFFNSLVVFLSDVTRLDYILVGKVGTDSDGKFIINTTALAISGKVCDDITYPMWKGPCYEVIRGKVYSYPSNCRTTFPENETLAKFHIEGYLGYPLCDISGKPVGLIAAMHREEIKEHETITAILRIAAKRAEFELDRLEYEKALQKHNTELQLTTSRLQSTFDGVPAMIALLDVVYDDDHRPSDFVITAANQAAADFTGINVRELTGKRMMDLYPEAWCKLLHKFVEVLQTGEPVQLEFFNEQLKKWFAISVTRQSNGNGVVSFILDITQQKKAEEDKKQHLLLTELDRAKTEFFGNVSHEFRTPITLLLGPIEDILTKGTLGKPERSRLEMAHRNALRLQKLVNSLLDFSRIESGRFDTVFQPTDVGELTAHLASNFSSAIQEAGLRFIVRCEKGHSLYVNRNMWEKIVLNLLSNAFKFTFEGMIEIKIKSVKRHVQLHVCDSGIGISQENLSKIFKRFVRIENARARAHEGSGIGLALVKQLVDMHGGSIKVKSTPGKGTEFIVTMPKGKNHLPPAMIHEFQEAAVPTTLSASFVGEAYNWLPERTSYHAGVAAKQTILLVDDNLDMRKYLRSFLSHHFNVVEAADGTQAMVFMKNGLRPSVILSDMMMPEMNGLELLQALKSDATTMNVPFVFLSAKASEQERIQGLRAGADHYMMKPFSADELLAVIKSKVSKHEGISTREPVSDVYAAE